MALDQWHAHPLVGIGYENFQVPYLAARRTSEAPRFAHSLILGVLAGTGLVGAVLLSAALASAAIGAWSSLRAHPQARGLGAGALAGATGWLVGAQTDWLWEFPALGILAFALLGLAVRAGGDGGDGGGASTVVRGRARRVGRRFGIVQGARRLAVGGLVVGIAAALSALGSAGRLSSTAYEEAATQPQAAILALARAAWLEPLSADPLITRGIVARRIGLERVAGESLREAVGREPDNWFARLELGMLDAEQGGRSGAITELERSRHLDPGEALLGPLIGAVSRGEPVDTTAVEGRLYAETQRRLTPVGGG